MGNKTFFQKILLYFSSFIVMLILTIGVLFGLISESILKEQTSRSSSDYLNQILHNIDGSMRDISRAMINLGLNANIAAILNSNKPTIDKFSEYLDVMETLQTVKNSNKYLDSIYLYVQGDDKILTNYKSIFNTREFGDLHWMEDIQTKSGFYLDTRKVYSTDVNRNVNLISMVNSLPILSNELKMGALVFNIDEEILNSTISRKKLRNNEEILIINKDGQIVSSKNKDILYQTLPWTDEIAAMEAQNSSIVLEIGGIKSFVVYETSSELGWRIVSIIPYDELFKAQHQLTRMLMMICIASLLIFLLFAGIASRILYHPISNLLNLLPGSNLPAGRKAIGNDIKFINESVRKILDDKEFADQSLKHIKPIAREKFLVNLLDGYYDNSRQIEKNMHMLDIGLYDEACIVLLIEVDRPSDWEITDNEIAYKLFMSGLKEMIEDFLDRNKPNFVVGEVDSYRMGAVLNDLGNAHLDADAIYFLCLDLKEHISMHTKYTVTIGIGRPVSGLVNLKKSYKEALRAIKQKMIFGKNNVIRINDVEKSFDLEGISENEYINLIISQLKDAKLRACIEKINNTINFMVGRGIDSKKMHKFCHSLLHFITFTLIEMGIDTNALMGKEFDLIEDFAKNEDVDDIKLWFRDLFVRLEQFIEQKKNHPNHELIEKIKLHVAANYHNEFTLNDIASLVYMNPSYLGKLFKKMEGVTFNEYINQVRMEKAKEMLLNTTLKVAEISEKVGMSSAQYFIYCFRNFYGITPKKFREGYYLNNHLAYEE